jgi:WD40 repeat protein
MNPELRRAIARVDIVQNGRRVRRGTATLVADGLALTALHVVADRSGPEAIPHSGVIRLTFPGHHTTATIRDGCFDAAADWVLLQCDEPPRTRPLPLGELEESHLSFETFGFPEAQAADGMVQTGRVENHDAELAGIKVFQLFSHQAAAGDGAPVQGASGSPVIVDGALVGILRAALLNERLAAIAGTLYACPIDAVLARCERLLPVPDPFRGLPGLPRLPLPAQPYSYLNPFTAADAEIFFGRSRDIRQLLEQLTGESAPKLLLLYGQAGVGKSSFLDAGVVPRLGRTHIVRYARCERGSRLQETAVRALQSSGDLPGSLLSDAVRRLETRDRRPVTLILDQVEEIFTHGEADEAELADLVTAIAETVADPEADPHSRVVLAFRKEWFPEVQKQVEVGGLSYGKVFLERLDHTAVLDIIMGLTRTRRLRQRYGLSVEPRLAGIIADDLQEDRDSPIAPTLQILLSKMWEQATALNRAAPAFTTDLYQRLKREGVLLGDFLDQQLAHLSESQPLAVSSGFAIDVLAFHTSPLLTAQYRSRGELIRRYHHRAADLGPLVDGMKQRFLLADPAGDRDSGASNTRLAHDTLAPLVRQRFDESDRPGQRARRILEAAAADWRNGGIGATLDTAALEAVECGRSAMRVLEASEERLIEASRARRARELRRHRFTTAGLWAAAALIVVALAVAVWFAIRAEQERRLAVATARTLEARQALTDDPARAAELLASLRGFPEPAEGARIAQEVLSQPIPIAILDGHAGDITHVAFRRDGREVVTSSKDGSARIWHLDGGASTVLRHSVSQDQEQAAVTGSAIDQAGGRIVTYSQDGTLRLWTADGKEDGDPLVHPEGAIGHAEFDDTGKWLLTVPARGRSPSVWHVASRRSYRLEHQQPVSVAHFIHGGEVVTVVTVSGGDAHLWTVDEHGAAQQRLVAFDRGAVTQAQPNATGEWLALGTDRGTVWLVERGGMRRALSMPNPPTEATPVRHLRVDSSGRRVLVGWPHTAALWDLIGDRTIPLPPSNNAGVGTLETTADITTIAVAGAVDGTVRLWKVTSAGVSAPLDFRGHVEFLSVSANGNLLATASPQSPARVWPTVRRYPAPIGPSSPPVAAANFDVPGTHAALISSDGAITLWQIAQGHVSKIVSASRSLLTPSPATIDMADGGSSVIVVSDSGRLQVLKRDSAGVFSESVSVDDVAAATVDRRGVDVVMVDAKGTVRSRGTSRDWSDSITRLPAGSEVLLVRADGTRAIAATGSRLVLIDVERRQAKTLTTAAPVLALSVSADSQLGVATKAGIQVWPMAAGSASAQSEPMPLPGDSVTKLKFSGDGSMLVVLDAHHRAHVLSPHGARAPVALDSYGEALRAITFVEARSDLMGITATGRWLHWVVGWDDVIAALERWRPRRVQ